MELADTIPVMMEKCPAAVRDEELVNNWQAWIKKQISNPETLMKHVMESMMVNHNDIIGKESDMEENYKAGDWFNVGIDLGSMMSESTLGATANPEANGEIGFNGGSHIFPMMPGPVIFTPEFLEPVSEEVVNSLV